VQTTLLGLAIALILALLAALVGPFFIDWTQYRPAFEMQASRALGLPVRVSGPIDVRLLPSPSLLLNRIEIGSEDAAQPLRAKALGIELALGSLIRGQVRATELRLVGPDVVLGLGKDGRLNGPGLAVGLNLNDVSIGKLSIEDARVTLADAASGKRTVFEKMWFGGDVRSLGTGIFRGEGAFVLSGGLHAYRIVTARSEEGDVRIKFSLEPSHIPLLAESEGVLSFPEGVLRFEGGLTLTRPVGVALAGGKTEMGEPWRVTSRVAATPASALFEQLELQYGPEERALKATGTAEMIFGEKPHLEAVVSARQIEVDRVLASQDQPRRDPASAVNAIAGIASHLARVPFPLQVGFGIDGMTLGGGAIQSLRGDVAVVSGGLLFRGVELRAPGFTQIQMSGRLMTADGPSFSGPVEIGSVDPRAFAAWLEGKTESPSGAASPLRGRGEIVIDSTRLAVERLALDIDRKPVNGRLAYTFASGERKARLDAELRAADADIDAMMTLANAVLRDTKLDRPGEIALALDMERARFAGLDAQRAHVKASFDAGGLKIERLNIGDFGGARIDARGVIDLASAPRGNVTVDLEARDLSGFTALAAKFAPQSSHLVREISERAGSASLRATLDVGAAQQAGLSQARLDLSGNLAATRVDLKGSATGAIADWAKANFQLDGELAGGDAGTLLRLIGAERLVAIENTGGKVTLTAAGPLDGDTRFEARIVAGGLDARANGRVRLFSDQERSGEFDIAIARADAGVWLQPQRALPVAVSARAVLAGSSLKLNQIVAQIGGAPLRGRLGLLLGQVVELDGDVETDAVDAAALIAAATGMPAGNNLHAVEPFTRGLYAQASGRIAFRARSADLTENLTMRGVKGGLRFAPSLLAIEIEDAEFAKGRLSGEVSARKAPDGVSTKSRLVLKGADAALLSSQVSGRVNLNAELDGTGRSPKALIGSLSGAGTLTLADARISGLDPLAFATAMRAVDQGLPLDGVRVRDVVIPALERGALSVRVAEAPFTVSGGQVRFGTLLAQADKADVSMSGVLDLAERTLESRIVLTDAVATTSAGRPEISLQLKGPVAAPARNVEVAALTGWLALRAVEQQSKKLEAIERGGVPPVTSSVPAPPAAAAPPAGLPERAPVMPRTRPSAEARPSAAPLAAPLPPPVDIKPAPGFAPVQGEPRSQMRPAPQTLTPPPRGSNF
jgi:large subunit ribosomal protein L24